jgi:DNA polymerase III delta subunit
MPKLDSKIVQKEMEQGTFWPVYWIYGQEHLKVRELLKRIRRAVLGVGGATVAESDLGLLSGLSWRELFLDAGEIESAFIVDEAMSPCLAGGTRLIVIRDAHALKNLEVLSSLLGPPKQLNELVSVCVFISKDLDARKKFSKILNEKAAVIPCEEVPENQREAWIQFLAKRRKMELSAELLLRLSFLEPWSLDLVDQELEKASLSGFFLASGDETNGGNSDAGRSHAWVTGGGGKTPSKNGTDLFLESFFRKELKSALPWAGYFSERPDEALPLLGLLGWNVKQLVLLVSERESGVPAQVKLNPYLADRWKKWSQLWSLKEVLELQKELFVADFSMKQTPLPPLGIWTALISRFCS